MVTKEHTKLLLLLVLLSSLFMRKVNISKNTFNTIVVISIVLFTFSIINDLMFGLLIVSIAYVIFSKLYVKEKFSNKTKKDIVNDKNKDTYDKKEKIKKKDDEKKPEKVQETNELPGHCSKIKNMNDEFIKEYEVSGKNLEDVQNNVFDKYNYGVFYNELGENSLDIQGVFNHEVNGFEKNIF
tara:strand:+ start:30683 stop:31231 length:549 start_codon:yes stop_codon:yes gene_type:complete